MLFTALVAWGSMKLIILKPIETLVEGSKTKLEDRALALNKEIVKNVKIETDYAALLRRNLEKGDACLVRSRLFDAELEFPPFDFLRQSDGKDELYDYA